MARARYLPPFRLYLVVSVASLLFLGPADRDSSSVDLDEVQAATAELDPGERPDAQDFCYNLRLGFGSLQTQSRAVEICRNIAADHGRFGEALWENVPKMMFVFLPLIALVSLALYAFSGRYYVEHLLFFVHFHAFVFLAFLLEGIFSLPGTWFAPLEFVAGIIAFAMVFYFPIYLYKSMRHVFQQGRALTAIKFVLLSGAHCACLLATFIGLLLYTGITL